MRRYRLALKTLAMALSVMVLISTIPVNPVSASENEETAGAIMEIPQESGSQDDLEENAPGEDVSDDSVTQETESAGYPAFTPEAAELDGVKISVYAPEGVFPEGAVLSVRKADAAEQEKAETAVDELRGTEKNVAVSYTFDIKVLDADGNELKPTDAAKVRVSFSLAEAADGNLQTDIYHVIKDEATEELQAEKLDIITDESELGETESADPETTVVVETDGFSFYTVEFTYNSLQYDLAGDASVPLSEIIGAVGLTGEATVVEVSSSELFSASNETGEWIVTAHQAFDTTEWMKVTINDVVYEISVTASITGVSSWSELQDAIKNAQDGDVITLSQDIDNQKNGGDRIKVDIGKTVTIDLNGYKLNRNRTKEGSDGHVIEVFKGSTLIIRDSSTGGTGTITGGYSARGGGIYVNENATLKVESGTITGNHADDDGGGIYVKGTLIMTGGAVSSNIAADCGGGIFCEDSCNVQLTNASVQYNHAENDGGGMKLWMGANSSISNCRITYNVADDHGGGMYMDAKGKTLTITDTNFDNNTSSDDGAGFFLYRGTIEMTGGSISNNQSSNDSGGAKITSNTSFTASNVTISGNEAASEEGGGIKNYGETTLKNCTITGNKAKKNGGGVYNNDDDSAGRLTMENCLVTGNTSQSNGGGVYSDEKLILIGGDNMEISGNSATKLGGGIFLGDGSEDTEIQGKIVVKENTSVSGGKNIYLRNGKLAVKGALTGSEIGITKEDDNGQGKFTSGYGANNKSEDKVIEPSTFFFSPEGLGIANADGEASLVSSWPGLQSMINDAASGDTIVLDHNYSAASNHTRLLIPENKTITIDLAGYTLNRGLTSEKENGHVIEVLEGATLTIQDSSEGATGMITGGYSAHGGGIYVNENATLKIEGGTITENRADDDGGGIFTDGTLVMTGGTVSKNRAEDNGGGIFCDKNGSVSLTGSSVTNNYAGNDGGGMKLWLAEDSSISNCEITENSSGDHGGGMYMDAEGRTLTITDTKFDNNSAVDDGGGIFLYYGTIRMNRTEGSDKGSLSGNTSENDSGGIKVTAETAFYANGITISGNKAAKEEGGGIKNYGTTTLTGCTVSGNSAAKTGGGIHNNNDGDSDGKLTIDSCTITGNSSGTNGGGIYSDEKLTIKGTTTIGGDESGSGNAAADRGGGIFIGQDSETTCIEGTLIVKNNADATGSNDFYLRKGQVLKLTGAITGTDIGKIDMDSIGVFTKNYSQYHSEADPSAFFCTGGKAISAEWNSDHTEAQLKSNWKDLQNKIDAAASGESAEAHVVTLETNYTAGSDDDRLKVHGEVTIDLNGYTLNRNCTSEKKNGHVIEVYENAHLTIKDSGTDGSGTITGGYSAHGGGIYVNKGAVLTVEGGTISGNLADDDGGGIYTDGALVMTGGTVTGNSAKDNGGGIFCDKNGSVSLKGVSVTGNTAGNDGGGMKLWLGADASIDNCRITNNYSEDHGGGMYVIESPEDDDVYAGKTLTISETMIEGNTSIDDGAGIFLYAGYINMNGGSLSGNNSYNDGGGAKIAGTRGSNADDDTITLAFFTATGVAITGNKAMKEEGGGVKNFGTATLTDCTITKNSAGKEGGGLHNTNDGDSWGNMTIANCTIQDNKTEQNGGGIYSDAKLSIIGGTISGNSSVGYGGGVFIGQDSKDTSIQGALVIRDNTAEAFGDDLYLRSDCRLILKGALEDPADIHTDLEKGTGVVAKDYRKYHPEDGPEKYFTFAAGYDVIVNEDGAAELTSEWGTIKDQIENAESGSVITLDRDYAAATSDGRIKIDGKKNITIDLNGHTLNRNRKDKTSDGHVLEVFGGSTLTIKDSTGQSGKITGGWSECGGGIYVNSSATLNLEGGTVTGNRGDKNGGGILVKGTVNMKGGAVTSNEADGSGGGIYLEDDAVLNLTGGTISEDNHATGKGGGVMVCEGALINVAGNPIADGNRASGGGNDIYLPTSQLINVSGALTEEASLGVSLQDKRGTITKNYGTYNGENDPAQYFESTDGYAVYLEGNEAVFGFSTFGKTEYEDPFISWNNQINTDAEGLSNTNWMSGISGERYLNEINTPRSHDSGMNNIDNKNVSQGITEIIAGSAVLSIVGNVATGGFFMAGTAAWCAIAAAISVAMPNDNTSVVSFFLEEAAAPKAKTQKEYIDQQLEDGARILDVRLNNRKKVYKFISSDTFNGWTWSDDGSNLWICHGKKSLTGTYLALGPDDEYLSFTQVLEWTKEFLAEHPTETVTLCLTPETADKGQFQTIYERARKILEASALQINPATNEPYLYKEPGSDDYFATYTHMPKLADCRGKIVIKTGSELQPYVGGMGDGQFVKDVGGADYKETPEKHMESIRKLAAERGVVALPTDADTHLDFWWSMGLSCTGESEMPAYLFIDAPHVLSEEINPALIGDGKLYGPEKTGEYIGIISIDGFRAEYAEPIWRTNFFDGLQYCTVTVKSGLSDPNYPDQTYQVLKGTTITIPDNIYKKTGTDQCFGSWLAETADAGNAYYPGAEYKVEEDVTFTAQWLEEGNIPVRVVWNDGEDEDKLRPASLNLNVSTSAGASSALTLKASENWNTIATDNITAITPAWELVDTTSESESEGVVTFGTDVAGMYQCEISHEAGSSYIVTLTNTPQKKINISGTVTWDDDGNAAEKRPDNITIRLFKGTEEIKALTVSGTGSENSSVINEWQYDFGSLPLYENGKLLSYSIREDTVEGYTAAVSGFSVTNSYVPETKNSVNVGGAVQWNDDSDAEGLRPAAVVVTLLADGKKVTTRKAEASAYGVWAFSFNGLEATDADGNEIKYSFETESVSGYRVSCEEITEENTAYRSDTASDLRAQNYSLFLITYTLDVQTDYTWAEDNSTVTATLTSRNDASHVKTETVKTTSKVTKAATCEEAGETTYTAAFKNGLFETQTKTEEVAALGHDWNDPSYTWAEDNSTVTAMRTCKRDASHVETETAKVSSKVTKAADCEEAGEITYTAVFENKAFETQTKTEEGSAFGHDWGSPVYTWAEDNSTVTATRTCKNDTSHVETETAKVSSIVTKAATCEEAGEITYTAEFANIAFETQTKTEEVAAPGHDWGEWVVVKEATETGEGLEERICRNDPEHKETRVIPVKPVVHKDGWELADGKWYYYLDNEKQKDWLKDEGKWYYLDPETGAMQIGWLQLDENWYYLCRNGERASQWIPVDGYWYYMEPETGIMQTGWITMGGYWYYLYPSGQMAIGWLQLDGNWYYLCRNGERATQWIPVDGYWYYMEPETGIMQTGWVKWKNYWYFLYDSGAMATGWLKWNDSWYYLNENGRMLTGWVKVKDVWYFFKANGEMAANEWYGGYWLNADGSWTYPYQGSWKQNAVGWWFGDTSGWAAKNTTLKIDGTVCLFNAAGYWEP